MFYLSKGEGIHFILIISTIHKFLDSCFPDKANPFMKSEWKAAVL